MSLFKKLFGRTTTFTEPRRLPLHSSNHPARAEIDKAEEHARKVIQLEVASNFVRTTTDNISVMKMIQLIDAALQEAPDDPDLLYAKSCAFYLFLQGEDGKKTREQVLAIEPNHFDAKMKGEHFQTWDHIFHLPSWDENFSELSATMKSLLDRGPIQVVRNSLQAAIAVIFPDGGSIRVDGSSRIRWELRWVDTPHGKIAAHYIILDNGCWQEAILHHLADDSAGIRNGYWLLRRLAKEESCFLVITRGSRALRNQRYEFPRGVKDMLRSMSRDLEASGPCASLAQAQRAAQWYMDNVEVGKLKY